MPDRRQETIAVFNRLRALRGLPEDRDLVVQSGHQWERDDQLFASLSRLGVWLVFEEAGKGTAKKLSSLGASSIEEASAITDSALKEAGFSTEAIKHLRDVVGRSGSALEETPTKRKRQADEGKG